MNCILSIISMAILIVLPLLLAKVFEKLDKDLDIKLRKKDIVIFVIVAMLISVVRLVLCEIADINMNTYKTLHMTLLFGYLIYMSYTDQKTKELYSAISIVMLGIELASMAFNIEYVIQNLRNFNFCIFIVFFILFVVSLFKGIGFGDILIYAVIVLYLIQESNQAAAIFIMSILLTNIMFIVCSIITKISKHTKEKHLPLTIYIAISTILCGLMFTVY